MFLKKIMKSVTNWIKILTINIIIFLVVIFILEIGAGLSNKFTGKKFLPLLSHEPVEDINHNSHPCIEMKTDVLLNHVPNHRNECIVKHGIVEGEYIFYKYALMDKPKILTLGGSTTSGFYHHVSNGETYPKYLAKMISKTHFLINGGVAGYSSLQEFLKFARDGKRINKLDIVISLNGINDVPNYHGPENLREYYYPFLVDTQYLMNQNQKWVDQRIDNDLFTTIYNNFFPNISSLFIDLNNKKLISDYKENITLMNSINALERWETNILRINELVKLQNAKYYVFLQPTMGLNGVQSDPSPGTNDELIFNKIDKEYIKTLRVFYTKLIERCNQLSFCFDISSVAPPLGNNYHDKRHHNENGNKLIAEAIYEIIMR